MLVLTLSIHFLVSANIGSVLYLESAESQKLCATFVLQCFRSRELKMEYNFAKRGFYKNRKRLDVLSFRPN